MIESVKDLSPLYICAVSEMKYRKSELIWLEADRPSNCSFVIE